MSGRRISCMREKKLFGGLEHAKKYHYYDTGMQRVAALLLLVRVPRRSIICSFAQGLEPSVDEYEYSSMDKSVIGGSFSGPGLRLAIMGPFSRSFLPC